MKKILITGKNSFLGDNTKKYLGKYGEKYEVDILDVENSNWNNYDFSQYDVVFNVSAIVHRSDEKDESLYYQVNKDLALKIAQKAKKSRVKQLIQMSTVGVFGIEIGVMSTRKGFNPGSPYEKSKYEADILLEQMRTDDFQICIIRPPMIYGCGCKGNFPRLERFALKSPIFPNFNNKRDIIYIENMCDFVKFAIDNEISETCYPKNNEAIAVSQLVKIIANVNGKKIRLLSCLNPFVKMFYMHSRTLRSVFGDCYCTEPACDKNRWSAPYSTVDSIRKMYSNNWEL